MSTAATTSVSDLSLWALLAVSALCGAVIAGGGAYCFHRLSRRERTGGVGDDLTGLANRRSFVSRLERDWHAAREGRGDCGLLVIDVDSFGDINQIYGRSTGDRVLAEVAERINMRVRRDDFVARLDADEFAVLCKDIGPEGLDVVRRNLEAFVNYSKTVPVSLSIGVAATSHEDESSLDMLDRARASLSDRRYERPERAVDDALAALLANR